MSNKEIDYDVKYVYECPSCGDKMPSLAKIALQCSKCPSHDYMKLIYKQYRDGTIEEVTEEERKGCYIATACYGSYDAPEVQVLRRFRDETLLQTFWGKSLVNWYYQISPYLATKLKGMPKLNKFIRTYLLENLVKRVPK